MTTGTPDRPETAVRLYASGASAVIGPLDMDDAAVDLASAAMLRAEGVRIGFSTGDRGAGALRRTAALCVREGLPELDALRALTADAAAIAGIGEHAGTLVGGTTVVAWSASPVDLAARPLLVVVDGEILLDAVDEVAGIEPRRPAAVAPKAPDPEPVTAARPMLFRAARVATAEGPDIVDGEVLVVDGLIAAVGRGLECPEGTEVVDLGSAVLWPGLVDASSPIAGNVNEHRYEISPDWRVIDQIDLESPWFAAALGEGITTVYVSPGTANVIGGRGAVLRTAGARRVLRPVADLSVSLGRDAISGNRGDMRRTPPLAFIYRRPATRMAVNRALRWLLGGMEDGGRLMGDERASSFARAVAGGARLRVLARAAQDLRTAIRIGAEFGVPFVLEDATAAADVADDIARAGFPVILGTPPHPGLQGRAAEGADVRLSVAATLEAAGVPIAFGSRTAGSPLGLRMAAILAYRHGLSRDAALGAVTRQAARVCGVADRVGSIAEGKDADLVAFSGDPLDPASRVRLAVVGGRIVLDARIKGDER